MEVTIKIECETGGELYRHLRVLADQLRKEIKKTAKTGKAKKPLVLGDNNCYGWHEAKIKNYCADELLDELNKGDYPFRKKK